MLMLFIKSSSAVDKLLERYADLLENANKNMALISRRSIKTTLRSLLTDSLLPLTLPLCKLESPLIDIGSGAGIPGLPLAIARPDLDVTLLDSNRKKTSFLKMVIADLKLTNVKVIYSRIQTLIADAVQSGNFGTILSRATAGAADLLGWSEVLLKPGGELILWKGSGFEKEMTGIDMSGWSKPEIAIFDNGLKLVRFEKDAD